MLFGFLLHHNMTKDHCPILQTLSKNQTWCAMESPLPCVELHDSFSVRFEYTEHHVFTDIGHLKRMQMHTFADVNHGNELK